MPVLWLLFVFFKVCHLLVPWDNQILSFMKAEDVMDTDLPNFTPRKTFTVEYIAMDCYKKNMQLNNDRTMLNFRQTFINCAKKYRLSLKQFRPKQFRINPNCLLIDIQTGKTVTQNPNGIFIYPHTLSHEDIFKVLFKTISEVQNTPRNLVSFFKVIQNNLELKFKSLVVEGSLICTGRVQKPPVMSPGWYEQEININNSASVTTDINFGISPFNSTSYNKSVLYNRSDITFGKCTMDSGSVVKRPYLLLCYEHQNTVCEPATSLLAACSDETKQLVHSARIAWVCAKLNYVLIVVSSSLVMFQDRLLGSPSNGNLQLYFRLPYIVWLIWRLQETLHHEIQWHSHVPHICTVTHAISGHHRIHVYLPVYMDIH